MSLKKAADVVLEQVQTDVDASAVKVDANGYQVFL